MKPQKRFRFLIIALTATIFYQHASHQKIITLSVLPLKKLSRQLLTVRTKNTILRAI